MQLLALRAGSAPGERHNRTVLVHVAALEVLRQRAVTRSARLASHTLEIIRINESRASLTNHLVRPITQNRQRAWAYFDELAVPISDQDEIERRLEQMLRKRRQNRCLSVADDDVFERHLLFAWDLGSLRIIDQSNCIGRSTPLKIG